MANLSPLFYGLDPLHRLHLKLLIKDIYTLEQLPDRKDLYCFYTHPVKNVTLCGIVVAVEQTHHNLAYTLDDGTGSISCCQWKNTIATKQPWPLGTSLFIAGTVREYRGSRQVIVRSLSQVLDPNIEVLHAVEAIALHKNRYTKPFSLPSTAVENEDAIKKHLAQDNSQSQLITSSQLADPTPSQKFHKALLQYLKTEYDNDHFSCHEAGRGNPELERLARHMLIELHNGSNPPPRQVTELFVASVNALAKSGEIVQVDGPSGMYRVLTDEELQDTILKVIEEASTSTSLHQGGVLREFIIQQIISVEIYSRLSRERILQCLKKMVSSSILYHTAPREYKIVA
ncbi:CST complex subunit STN1 [Apophysomyces sp. BC1015]|nr:CST complex subunit STN1 [Apophysomyces sp. BC1015]KAG0177801.1 CST complex subunit STN1 [Apophysomyces sp. BC1021]